MGQPFELLDGKEKNKNQFMAVVDMCGIQGEAPKNITETTYMEKTYSVLGRSGGSTRARKNKRCVLVSFPRSATASIANVLPSKHTVPLNSSAVFLLIRLRSFPQHRCIELPSVFPDEFE